MIFLQLNRCIAFIRFSGSEITIKDRSNEGLETVFAVEKSDSKKVQNAKMQKLSDALNICLIQIHTLVDNLSKRNFPQSSREISEVNVQFSPVPIWRSFFSFHLSHLKSFCEKKKCKKL